MSYSAPAKFQTCAKHQPKALDHLRTGPSANQRRQHLQQRSTKDRDGGAPAPTATDGAQVSRNWGALGSLSLEHCEWRGSQKNPPQITHMYLSIQVTHQCAKEESEDINCLS